MWRRIWIRTRKGRRGRTYSLQWYDDLGRLRSKAAGSDKKVAEQLRRALEFDVNTGSVVNESSMRLSEFIREHLDLIEGQVTQATRKDQRETLQNFLGYCGDRPLNRLTERMAEGYFAKRLREVATATANKNLRTLRAIFNRAVKRGYRRRNPFDNIKAVREPERELRVLTSEEVGKLLGACPNLSWQAFIFLAVTTGMRSGELTHLTWDDVDMEARLVRVRCKEGHRTKSAKNRVVALVPIAVSLMRRLQPQTTGQWVFENAAGTQLRNNLRRTFPQILDKAGIRRCTIHDLRRTCFSHLANQNVNQAVVQAIAGHASIKTTQKFYTRIMPEAVRSAPERLPYANSVISMLAN